MANQTPMFHDHSKGYENAFIQTSLLIVIPKILLKTKCCPSKWFYQFSHHTEIMKNGCEIQTATPSSLHPLLLWNYEKNACIQDTPLSCHKWNFKNKKTANSWVNQTPISHVRVENEKNGGSRGGGEVCSWATIH